MIVVALRPAVVRLLRSVPCRIRGAVVLGVVVRACREAVGVGLVATVGAGVTSALGRSGLRLKFWVLFGWVVVVLPDVCAGASGPTLVVVSGGLGAETVPTVGAGVAPAPGRSVLRPKLWTVLGWVVVVLSAVRVGDPGATLGGVDPGVGVTRAPLLRLLPSERE